MATGDVVSDLQSKTDNSFLDIKPSAGEQWNIHNIFHEDVIELYWSDGTNDLLFATGVGSGVFAFCIFEVTSTHYVRVKNVSGATKLIGYSGKQC